jgi:hypothetical protein
VGLIRTILLTNRQLFGEKNGQLPKWPKGADCKSAVGRLRRFESFTAHQSFSGRKSLKKGIRQERQALIAQLVEHALGKGEVMGSSPIEGSFCRKNTSTIRIIKFEE